MTSNEEGVANPFVGNPDEENPSAKTAGEESHEDPWRFADLDAPNSPPENISEAIEEADKS